MNLRGKSFDILFVLAVLLPPCTEIVFGVYLSPWAYLCYAVLWSLAFSPFLVRRSSGSYRILFLVFLGLLLAAYFVPWTSRKRFLRDLYSIKPGMSVETAEQIMSRYPEGTGLPPLPNGFMSSAYQPTLTDAGSGHSYSMSSQPAEQVVLKDALVYRHSESERFNGDWGIVEVQSGRVVRVTFSMD